MIIAMGRINKKTSKTRTDQTQNFSSKCSNSNVVITYIFATKNSGDGEIKRTTKPNKARKERGNSFIFSLADIKIEFLENDTKLSKYDSYLLLQIEIESYWAHSPVGEVTFRT